uniref:Uncharacterized protein n=1 Tax=Clastoptera arizonana TaxID=38151 RepID=A0A1B6BW86_9HEMI
MDCKILLVVFSAILLAYSVTAELTEEDFRLLKENDIHLQQMVLKKSSSRKNQTQEATRKPTIPTPTLGPNPRQRDPVLRITGKKVITIEEYEVEGNERRPL